MDPLLFAPAVHPDHQDFTVHSPPHTLYDGSPHPAPSYDSFDILHDNVSHFPHTPSYNGSYQNSPYSSFSDLAPIDGADDSLSYLENPSGISITEITEEYDPSEYDVPSSTGPLILDEHYMNGAHVSVSVTPPLNDYSSPNAFDQASPASSNGLEDDLHSHSSNSSYMHPSSPRPDISQSFQDSLSFHSPAWPSGTLPDDRRSPPLHKPQSPPQLVIPDTTSPGGADMHSPPTINAPDGDGGLIGSGPTLQIVPATPVSGGGVSAQNVPFQDTLASLQSGAPSNVGSSDAQDWAHHQQYIAQSGQFTDQAFTFPPGSSSSSALADDSAQQHRQQYQRGQQFLLPQAPQRTRSLSDTSLRPPPVWDTLPIDQRGGTVNMNDVLPGPGQGPSSDPLLGHNFRHPSSAGPHQTSFSNQNNFTNQQYASDFLTVDAPSAIRRAKSDGGQRPAHTRQARSLDIRSTMSPNSGLLFPPPGPAQQDFIRASTQRQFLHPSEPVPSITRGHHRRSSSGSRERGIGGMMGMSGGMVAGWTGSSTSSARPSPYPSPSASPRPGYGALPLQDIGLSGLPGSGMGVGLNMNLNMGMPGSLSGQMGLANASMAGSINGQITVTRRQGVLQVDMPGSDGGIPMTVTRPHVTTPSTAKASHDRRKQPANFACPVPGCGSTFTRHFNLKGHLRSHAEEKPYQCKWPGCGKGFARQHDCKRHEQLHLNIRPYPCEGCKKNFARMDALNRHRCPVRSEGGAECRKIQEELNPGSTAHLDAPATAASTTSDSGAESSAPPGDVKPDPDGAWTAGGMMM